MHILYIYIYIQFSYVLVICTILHLETHGFDVFVGIEKCPNKSKCNDSSPQEQLQVQLQLQIQIHGYTDIDTDTIAVATWSKRSSIISKRMQASLLHSTIKTQVEPKRAINNGGRDRERDREGGVGEV